MITRGISRDVLLAFLVLSTPVGAVSTWGNWSYEALVVAEDPGESDSFASAVALSGSTLVVGAPGYAGLDGRVHIFERQLGGPGAWGEATVLASLQVDSRFGQTVAIEGGLLAVGSTHAEVVWLFERSESDPRDWYQVAWLELDGNPNEDLGKALAIAGDTIVAGAPQAVVNGSNYAGAVYVFNRIGPTEWEMVRLAASDPVAGEGLGTSVAFDGTTLIAGAITAEVDGLPNAGAAYVFVRDGAGGWQEGKKIVASDPGEEYRFGSSVGVAGDEVLVGAPRLGDNHDPIEGVYIFSRRGGEWIETARLFAEGETMSVSSGRAAIDGSHTVSVFERTSSGWSETAQLVGEHGYGGAAVVLDGDTLALGYLDVAFVYNAFDLTLAVAGNCPGRLRLELADAAPGTMVALASSPWTGRSVAGIDCPETLMYLADPVWLGTGRADDAGRLALDLPVGHGGCNRLFQAVDISACRTSNIATLARSSHVELSKFDSGADNFGSVVDLDGWSAVVSACCFPPDDVAYLYEADRADPRLWHLESVLVPSGGLVIDFGGDVALAGDAAAVTDNLADAAYVFERNEGGDGAWGQVARLEAYGGGDEMDFASSVSISGNLLAVGAAYQTGAELRTGAVYLYRRLDDVQGWVPLERLWVEGGSNGDRFGNDVAIDGGTLVVGARDATGVDVRTGTAYVFERNIRGGWDEIATLMAPDGERDDKFGGTVAIDGDTVVVGADWTANEAGAAYVFQRDVGGEGAWGLVKKLVPNEVFHQENFGLAVGISGDTILVASHPPGPTGQTGTVYVFERNYGGLDAWGEVDAIRPSDGVGFERFGEALAVSGEWLLVGARSNGGAYVYVQKPPWLGRP